MAKFTNDEIDNLIQQGKTNAEISRAMGVKQGNVNTRVNKRRAELEKAKTEVKPPVQKQEAPIPEPAAVGKPFPFEHGEQILYEGRLHIVSSVGHDRMVIRENASLRSKTITMDDYERNQGAFKKLKEKPQNTYERVTRNRPDEEPEPKISAGDIKVNGQPIKNLPDSVKEKIAEKLKEESEPKKPGMTINPEFEEAVQEMEAEHKARKAKEAKPCIHFLQNCRYCDLDNCEECPDFKDGITFAEACETTKPFVTEPVESFGASPDYIDPDWDAAEK